MMCSLTPSWPKPKFPLIGAIISQSYAMRGDAQIASGDIDPTMPTDDGVNGDA